MSQGRKYSLTIHATLDSVCVRGDIEQDLHMDADKDLRSLLSRPTPRSLDLLNIAAGVYAVDRAIKRRHGYGDETGVRSLQVIFAVHDLSFWQRAEITESVTQILCFLTDDHWSVTFEQATIESLPQEHQSRLNFPWGEKPRRIALFSGGLDSAAGLANRVLAGVDGYLLLTVGHHSRLRGHCAKQIKQLREKIGGRLMHATLAVHQMGQSDAAKRMRQQEQSQRSRAFLFAAAAAAAAAAQACKVRDIEVFENGVGAVNLPLMTGMLSCGMATRGAHPTFLKLMSNLASSVLERPIRYTLPFATQTKAEMLGRLRNNELESWLQLSRSCIHTSLRQSKISHCGQCPGCIERRQAFAAAGMVEQISDIYGVDLLVDVPLHPANADYLQRYLDDAVSWLRGDAAVRRRLARHLAGTDVPDEQYNAIARRQCRHAREVLNTLGHLTVKRIDKGVITARRNNPGLFPETVL